eukprot:746938-Pyramimonas_sp.AAC.1
MVAPGMLPEVTLCSATSAQDIASLRLRLSRGCSAGLMRFTQLGGAAMATLCGSDVQQEEPQLQTPEAAVLAMKRYAGKGMDKARWARLRPQEFVDHPE